MKAPGINDEMNLDPTKPFRSLNSHARVLRDEAEQSPSSPPTPFAGGEGRVRGAALEPSNHSPPHAASMPGSADSLVREFPQSRSRGQCCPYLLSVGERTR